MTYLLFSTINREKHQHSNAALTKNQCLFDDCVCVCVKYIDFMIYCMCVYVCQVEDRVCWIEINVCVEKKMQFSFVFQYRKEWEFGESKIHKEQRRRMLGWGFFLSYEFPPPYKSYFIIYIVSSLFKLRRKLI